MTTINTIKNLSNVAKKIHTRTVTKAEYLAANSEARKMLREIDAEALHDNDCGEVADQVSDIQWRLTPKAQSVQTQRAPKVMTTFDLLNSLGM
jgi:hypothetical protein